MRRIISRSCSFCFAVVVLFAVSSVFAEESKEKEARVALQWEGLDWCFFSEDDQATVGDTWKLESAEQAGAEKGKILHCTGEPRGYLYTKESYGRFHLTLQWRRCTEDGTGRGGVLLFCRQPHRIWPKSLEAQLNAEAAGDFWGLCDFSLRGPADRLEIVEHPALGKLTHLIKMKDAEKEPGQWNTYEILCDGETVTLTINGELVNRCRLILPGEYELKPGPICLTAEGDPIEFRGLKIESLEDTEAP